MSVWSFLDLGAGVGQTMRLLEGTLHNNW